MKYLLLLSLAFSLSTHAKISDAFMCYTQVDTVVLFGVLKKQGTLRINYFRLEQNPQTIDLKITRYERSDNSIKAVGVYNGKELISIQSKCPDSLEKI